MDQVVQYLQPYAVLLFAIGISAMLVKLDRKFYSRTPASKVCRFIGMIICILLINNILIFFNQINIFGQLMSDKDWGAAVIFIPICIVGLIVLTIIKKIIDRK